jgi:hypothetical protein
VTAAAALAAALLLFAVLVGTAARTTLLERTPALVRVRAPSGRRQTGR